MSASGVCLGGLTPRQFHKGAPSSCRTAQRGHTAQECGWAQTGCYPRVTVSPSASPSASPSSRLPADARRRQLLDVALGRFAGRGFHATSMEDIAEAAGVTKPVLYQHFPSKRALYLELLDDVGGRLQDAIGKATGEAATPREQVQAGFDAYVRFVTDQEDAFRLLFGGGARRDREFADAVSRVEEAIAAAIASLIDADIDAAHRQTLAWAIVGLAEGVVRRWIDTPAAERSAPGTLSRQVAELAWGGLRAVSRSDLG